MRPSIYHFMMITLVLAVNACGPRDRAQTAYESELSEARATVFSAPILHKNYSMGVSAIGFAPGGTALAVIASGNGVELRDLNEDLVQWSAFLTQTASIEQVGAVAGGKFVVAGYGGIVAEVNASTGDITSETTRRDLGNIIISMGISADGTVLAAGTGHGVLLINADELTVIERFQGALDNVFKVGFSQDGRYVYGLDSYNLYIWNFRTGALIQRIDTGYSILKDVAFSSDFTVAAVSTHEYVALYSVDTGVREHAWRAHEAEVTSMVFTSDFRTLITASHDDKINAWSTSTGIIQQSFDTSVTGGGFRHLTLSPGGRYLAAGYGNDFFLFRTIAP